ncbi:MAG: hypothetical protein U0841_15965 [Chloroflexia bacterium]
MQDGLRDGEHIRHWMHDTFVEGWSAPAANTCCCAAPAKSDWRGRWR